jgi:hypothetical protein
VTCNVKDTVDPAILTNSSIRLPLASLALLSTSEHAHKLFLFLAKIGFHRVARFALGLHSDRDEERGRLGVLIGHTEATEHLKQFPSPVYR